MFAAGYARGKVWRGRQAVQSTTPPLLQPRSWVFSFPEARGDRDGLSWESANAAVLRLLLLMERSLCRDGLKSGMGKAVLSFAVTSGRPKAAGQTQTSECHPYKNTVISHEHVGIASSSQTLHASTELTCSCVVLNHNL